MKSNKERNKRRRRRERKRKKIGAPPGSLTYIGEHQGTDPELRIFDFNKEKLDELRTHFDQDLSPYLGKDRVSWIDVEGLAQPEKIGNVGQYFGLHSLLIEDILNSEHRPKFEDHGDHLFLTLKMLYLPEKKEKGIISEQVSLVLGESYVLSFQEGKGDVFDSVRKRLENPKGRIRNGSPDHLFYALFDAIVDHYFLIIDHLEDRIEAFEDSIIEGNEEMDPRSIHELKKETVAIRKSIAPLREVSGTLVNSDNPLIKERTERYLRDVHDHVIAVVGTLETQRDMVSDLMESYMTFLTLKMNNIMKVLTIIASIFIPLTFIAGIYGMNFEHMPELNYPWAYPTVMFVMLILGLGMLLYFKRKKWI